LPTTGDPHSRAPDDWIRVVICDDVPALRSLVRRALEAESDLKVVGEAGDARDGVEIVARERPDVVLLDLSMPGMDGLEAIPEIRVRSPDSAIVVFSGFAAARMRQPALDLGADAYVEKGEPLERLPELLRSFRASGGLG
jgi:DNA-binding NarL/FixJ family response regulator